MVFARKSGGCGWEAVVCAGGESGQRVGVGSSGDLFRGWVSSYAVVDTNRTGGEETLDPARPVYTGEGGVELSSRLRRAAFWLHFGEYDLLAQK